MLIKLLNKISPRAIKVFKAILYVIFFSYLIISAYFGFDLNNLIVRYGIFTFFLFIKKWAVFGSILMLVLWGIENLHIMHLKQKIKDLEKREKN